MSSLSESSLSYIGGFLQWSAPICTGLAVIFALCSIAAKNELGRRQAKLISDQTVKIAELEKGTASAQAQAAQANEKAEGERLKRTQLEVSFEPRTIDVGAAAWRELVLFSGTKVSITCLGMDSEAQRCSLELAWNLEMVGWKVVKKEMQPQRQGTGIAILTKEVDGQAISKSTDAARILCFFLKDCGIEAMLFSPGPAQKVEQDDIVVVEIGSKRNWYFDSKSASERWDDMIKRQEAMLKNEEVMLNRIPPEVRPKIDIAKYVARAKKPAQTDFEANRNSALRYDPQEKAEIIKKHTPAK